MMINNLMKIFIKKFGEGGDILAFFSPGRVNLIGEHTDYNGGHVFPCALTIGTYGIARRREDALIRCYSMNFDELGVIEVDITHLEYNKADDWVNYVKGVIWAFGQKGHVISNGFDFVCCGTIPNKSGLSSSASLEVLTGKVLVDLFGLNVDNFDNALIGQYAENKFVGVNCGIMDQFAIAMGKADHAIFLDTKTLEYEYTPVELGEYCLVIANTNKERGLGDSKYNERRAECESALAEIQQVKEIKALGDLSEAEFEAVASVISNPLWVKRARHAVYENQRTIKAVEVLKANDLTTFGELMNASHVSLRDDYDVTGLELDTVVEAAWAQPDVIGSRMTGAGFGGCSVSIVKKDGVESFIKNVGDIYKEKIGYGADFYAVEIGDGPRQL